MRVGAVFRARIESLAGHVAVNLVPDREPTLADVQEEFPTGPDLARALGYGENRDHPRGSPGWRARRTLLDDYSRWRRGARNPFRAKGSQRSRARELRNAVRERWVGTATPASPLEVLRLIDIHGATVTRFVGVFDYEPGRTRIIPSIVYIAPVVLARRNGLETTPSYSEWVAGAPPIMWRDTARAFLLSWALAYGMDERLRESLEEDDAESGEGVDIDAWIFEIGQREEGQDYDYRQ